MTIFPFFHRSSRFLIFFRQAKRFCKCSQRQVCSAVCTQDFGADECRWMQMMLHADIFGIQTADRQCFSLTFCYLHNNNVQKSVAAVGKGPSASAWHRLANAHSEQFAICLLELWPRVDKSSEPSAKNLSAFLRTFALLGMQSKRQCGGSHWQRSTVTYLMQLCFLWIPHCEIEVRWRAWCGSACRQDRGGGSFIWSFDFVWTGGQVTLRTQTFV